VHLGSDRALAVVHEARFVRCIQPRPLIRLALMVTWMDGRTLLVPPRAADSSHERRIANPPRARIGHDRGMDNAWAGQHFSMGNPRTDGATDLPKLLRRMATEIVERQIDARDILDLTISREMIEEGPWWSATLYWRAGNSE